MHNFHMWHKHHAAFSLLITRVFCVKENRPWIIVYLKTVVNFQCKFYSYSTANWQRLALIVSLSVTSEALNEKEQHIFVHERSSNI